MCACLALEQLRYLCLRSRRRDLQQTLLLQCQLTQRFPDHPNQILVGRRALRLRLAQPLPQGPTCTTLGRHRAGQTTFAITICRPNCLSQLQPETLVHLAFKNAEVGLAGGVRWLVLAFAPEVAEFVRVLVLRILGIVVWVVVPQSWYSVS